LTGSKLNFRRYLVKFLTVFWQLDDSCPEMHRTRRWLSSWRLNQHKRSVFSNCLSRPVLTYYWTLCISCHLLARPRTQPATQMCSISPKFGFVWFSVRDSIINAIWACWRKPRWDSTYELKTVVEIRAMDSERVEPVVSDSNGLSNKRVQKSDIIQVDFPVRFTAAIQQTSREMINRSLLGFASTKGAQRSRLSVHETWKRHLPAPVFRYQSGAITTESERPNRSDWKRDQESLKWFAK
jgi:hypothetical protein